MICSITICARDRRRIFAEVRAAAAAVSVLREHARATHVAVHAYCVMPDHVHLVVSPSPTCDIITFVGQFKNLAQRAVWRVGVSGRIWQTAFYDHFLRAEEQVERVAEYVVGNPVRAGIVQQWREYPFAGSLVYVL